MNKIEVFKRWTTRADATVVFPEELDIREIEYILSPIDVIIQCHLRNLVTAEKSKNWYSVNIAPIVPTMVRTLYQRLHARGNCYGAAKVAGGITPFLNYGTYDSNDHALTNMMILVHTGYLQAGDLIYVDLPLESDFHGFIYLDADLSLSMNGYLQPWRFQSTRSVLNIINFPKKAPFKLCRMYDHIDKYTHSIPWAKVYRKTQPSPCWENKEVLDVINNIYEIMIAHPELVNGASSETASHYDTHPQYQPLLDNVKQLKVLTKNHRVFDQDFKTLFNQLPFTDEQIIPTQPPRKKLRV